MPRSEVAPLCSFADDWGAEAHRFHDRAIDAKREALLKATRTFLRTLGEYTCSLGNGFHGFTAYQKQDTALFEKQYGELDDLGTAVADAYEELVRTARQRLSV